MTKGEHKARHVELHQALGELVADWITHNPDKRPSSSTIWDLLEWSAVQAIEPNHPYDDPEPNADDEPALYEDEEDV